MVYKMEADNLTEEEGEEEGEEDNHTVDWFEASSDKNGHHFIMLWQKRKWWSKKANQTNNHCHDEVTTMAFDWSI